MTSSGSDHCSVMSTLHNVCAVHRGCAVHWKMLITLGEYHWVHRGCSVHWGDIMSTLGVFSTVGDTMSTPGGAQYTGGYHDECRGYHEYSEECSVHWGFHTNSIVFPMTFPNIYHDIPQCTHDIPHNTHDIPWCTEHPLLYCTPPVYCKDIMQGDKVHWKLAPWTGHQPGQPCFLPSPKNWASYLAKALDDSL